MKEKTVPDNSSVINGKAVASLTLGILSIPLPFLGLALGILSVLPSVFGLIFGILSLVFYKLARNEMAWTGEGGKGLAIAGLNCGIAGIFIQTLLIMVYYFFFFIMFQQI